MNLYIKKLHKDVILPTRSHPEDAGLDVYSRDNVVIDPFRDHLFELGFSCQFQSGYVLLVKDKSGRAIKNKIHTGAGVIDSNFRGEICVYVYNLGENPVHIKKGEKIAQLILVPVWIGEIVDVGDKELDKTTRGENGFGSTGLKHNDPNDHRSMTYE